MDIRLVLYLVQRQFFQQFAAAPAQVAIQFGLQELAHLPATVFLLHHHQCRVLGQRLGQHRCTLHVGADHLVRPPLVRDLVRGHVEHVVDVLLVTQVGDEADRLRVGNRVGEGLGKRAVAGELDDPDLLVLVRREVGFVISQ